SNGWVRYQHLRQPMESFLGDFRYAGKAQTLELGRVKLDAGDTGLALRGKLWELGSKASGGRLALDGSLKTRLGQWQALVPTPIAGLAQADFQLRGTGKAPQIAAELHGQRLEAQGVRDERLDSRLSAT